MNIKIVTPTYNRGDKLNRLYRSLQNQSNTEFEWIIIDDGSSDNTREIVHNWIKSEALKIKYVYQQNSGKCVALNRAFSENIDNCLYVIVDSDDYLLDDAIDIIRKYIQRYENNKRIGAFFFHYFKIDGEVICSENGKIKKDYIGSRYNYNNRFGKHDGCICYLSRTVKDYKYPHYENEKYMGPTVIQMLMSKKYDIVFSPEIIGVAEYQENGLTKSGRLIRLKNPLGMIMYSGLQQTKDNRLYIRFKYAIMAFAYKIYSGYKKEELEELGLYRYINWYLYIPSLLLATYWRIKYDK